MSDAVKKEKFDRYIIVSLQKTMERRQIMQSIWKKISMSILVGTLVFSNFLCVHAEETVLDDDVSAGYHVYDVQEDQVTDTWYGIARGDYLQSGIAKLMKDGKGYAICSGTTMAHKECDRVYVRIYLDQSDTGTGNWGTIDYWTGIAYDNSVAITDSGSYKITRGKYYSVKGSHSVIKDDIVEATVTCTDALHFD